MDQKKETSVRINFIYNFLYQFLVLVIPLITTPYVSRVIGVEGVGIYSYTYSIVFYFMMFVLLGVHNYGNRTIAKCRDNINELSKKFWGIYLIQLIMGLIVSIAYYLYIYIFDIDYKDIAIIESLFIISNILDINWFFFGLEEFKKTITRNTVVKICSLVLIFMFVKNHNDLNKYAFIMAGTTCISQLIMWGFLKNRIKLYRIKPEDIIIHLKPNLKLFIPVIAISLYKMMDKIMLGKLSNISEVGLYENAEKIINVPMTFIAALGTVMLPRISNIVSKGKEELLKEYMKKSINVVMFMAFPMSLGLIAISKKFAPIYFGYEFLKTGELISFLSITIIFLAFADIIRKQYLIPKEKDNIYIISVMLGAVVNLIMNMIFIPKYKSIGACFGTILAEFVVMFYQVVKIRKEIDIIGYLKNIYAFLLKSLIMFTVIILFNYCKIKDIYIVFLQIIVGVLIYLLLNIKFICEIINVRKIKEKLNKKMKEGC